MGMRTASLIFALVVLPPAFGASSLVRADAAQDAAAEAQKAAAALADRIKSPDEAVQKAALAEALKVQHPLVTAALGKALSAAAEPIRAAALEALVARSDEAGKKAAAVAVAARLERIAKKNEDYAERLKVIAALHDLAQPSSLRVLAAETGVDVPAEELVARMHAIANLPCKDAVEEIIQFRASGRRRSGPAEGPGGENRGKIARDAFAYAVGVDVGQDPDAMRTWWKDHEKGFDFQSAAERRSREGANPKGKGAVGEKPPKAK